MKKLAVGLGLVLATTWTSAYFVGKASPVEVLVNPVVVKPLRANPSLSRLPAGWQRVAAKFRPDRPADSLAEMLHHVENRTPVGAFDDGNRIREELADSFLKGRPHAKYPVESSWLYRDQDGRPRIARYAVGEVEAHPSQILATFAALDVPSNRVVRSGTTSATLAELIEALRDDFNLDGEVEWKTMALLRYAPTRQSWVNRWGRSFDFDQVAAMLLQLAAGEGSCHGTHVLQTLAVLLRVDATVPVVSPNTREMIRRYLLDVVGRLEAGQRPTGYWAPDWATPHPNRDDYRVDSTLFPRYRLAMVSGHHLEWLDLLDGDISIDATHREAAVRWCIQELNRVTPDEIRQHFCPYSHCFRVATRNADAAMWDERVD